MINKIIYEALNVENMMSKNFLLCTIAALFIFSGCISPKISVFGNGGSSLKEYTLEGTGEQKILVIPVRGTISDKPKKGLLKTGQALVPRIVSHLKKAEKDEKIKAVLFKINSSGGTVTASDILYNEILEFKKRTGKIIVVSMMNTAASGAYYISLPADKIFAHPTTITGSIGVIYLRPVIRELVEKIGAQVNITKTGIHKDMGSIFRKSTSKEDKIIQNIVDDLGKRFLGLVKKHRKLDNRTMEEIATARVWLADEAEKLGLVDSIGYLEDAVKAAKKLAKLPDNSKLVIYRHKEYHDDNIYNSAGTGYTGQLISADLNLPDLNLLDLNLGGFGLLNNTASIPAGFYFLWLSGLEDI